MWKFALAEPLLSARCRLRIFVCIALSTNRIIESSTSTRRYERRRGDTATTRRDGKICLYDRTDEVRGWAGYYRRDGSRGDSRQHWKDSRRFSIQPAQAGDVVSI